MVDSTGRWTTEVVAARLHEAAMTGRRLPSAMVKGYYNTWPMIVRQEWERWALDDRPMHRFPPSPEAVERMMETMRWMQLIREEQRRLLWMRAHGQRWREISTLLACDRNTARRRWEHALASLMTHLSTGVAAK